RARGGAIELLSVGPNPADQRTTLRFMLDNERTVAIAVYDISGARVMELADGQQYQRGETTVALDVSSLSSGAYFVSIISNRGEQATQRLIIQH
ncbi:MAG: T9SS type A sorting domain-containing protein, partial [Candidatus Kapabacteria bacterium]|nr:T9SS type A sorting domain-containing protein [Candidatus Kapabacteria bacterium]